ncbi:hypothetical protein OUZ56_021937 [Daphnia magna]|uniref:Uncharacterized protein n=1 Tax=Daphnia magna TaxID=35525 RepID=A0ABR0AUW0_9CRUS|nr:hypothetical protein OUZ56_021937 [Daphnia magna]
MGGAKSREWLDPFALISTPSRYGLPTGSQDQSNTSRADMLPAGCVQLTTLATAYIGGHTYSSGLSGFNSYKQFSDCPVPISNPLYEKPQLISFGKSSFSNFLPLTVTLNLHGRLNFTVSIVLLLLALVSSCCWYWRWPSWRVISTSTQQAPPICLPLVRSSDRL